MKTFLLLLALLLPGLIAAQSEQQHQKDSLRNVIATTEGEEKLIAYKNLMDFYSAESMSDDLKMDTLLILYDALDTEAQRQKNYFYQGHARLSRIGAHKNRKEFAEVILLAPDYLTYLAKHDEWNFYFSIFRAYLDCCIGMGEYNNALDESQRMYNVAHQQNHDIGKGQSLVAMALLYSTLNRNEEAEKCSKECIDIIKDLDIVKIGPLMEQAYFRWCEVLAKMRRFDEGLQVAQEYEKFIYRYAEHYIAKPTGSLMNLWYVNMMLYAELEDFDQLEIYCDKVDSVGIPGILQHVMYGMRARIYHHRKQYREALEMVNKATEGVSGSPYQALGNMTLKLEILCAMRESEDIFELHQQTVTQQDSIRNKDFSAKLDELRTVYEVDKITAEKVRNRNYFLLASLGCFLLAVTLCIWIFYSRTITQKNKGLYLRIKEQDRLVEALEAMKRLPDGSGEALPDGSEEIGRGANTKRTGSLQQLNLVSRLQEYLLLNKNFTNPEIECTELVTTLRTNKTYLYEAIKIVTGKTLQEYINFYRLEEARRMFDNQSNLKINVIATECGFNTYRTFHRAFRERYKMNPEDYRNMSIKKVQNENLFGLT